MSLRHTQAQVEAIVRLMNAQDRAYASHGAYTGPHTEHVLAYQRHIDESNGGSSLSTL